MKYNIEAKLTSKILEMELKELHQLLKIINYEYVLDIQGDEPLVNPDHIDIVAESISKNLNKEDIIIPTLEVPYSV